MSKKCKEDRVETVREVCPRNEGVFDNIICLIIVLIVLQFLCALLAGEEEDCC